MAYTLDYINKIIYSDTSITDMVMFHYSLRDIESSAMGVLYPTIHSYKEVSIGGGAIFPSIEFINGWTLQFPTGSFEVSGGNLKATINPTPDCYVERIQASSYAVTYVGSEGPTPEDISAAVWSDQKATELLTESDVLVKIITNKREIKKIGSVWTLVVYDDDNTSIILSKPLKDYTGNDITDLVPGVLAQEMKSNV